MADTATSPIAPGLTGEDTAASEAIQAEIARLNEQLKRDQEEIARLQAIAGDDDAIPVSRMYRLTVEQYHAIARAGIIGEDEPVELLEGWLVRKMTKLRPHIVATGLVREALREILPSGWFVDSQEPITTGDSEPEPDASVIRGGVRDYRERHPGPADLALVIEVADSSLAFDRGAKKRLYARAGIHCYWIVNLVDRRIEVYTDPTGPTERPTHREHRDYGPDERVPVEIDDVVVASLSVEELLP